MKYLLTLLIVASCSLSFAAELPTLTRIHNALQNKTSYKVEDDYITWTHESIHGLNSQNRQGYSGYNAFYIEEGRYTRHREPAYTLAELAAAIPPNHRGNVYQLYLIDAQRGISGTEEDGWNRQSLYVLDEWNAYTYGSQTRAELGTTSRGETVEYMLELAVYGLHLGYQLDLKGQLDEKLRQFIIYQFNMSLLIAERNDPLGIPPRYVELINTDPVILQMLLRLGYR